MQLFKKNILIELDYKAKIILGNGPRELNSEFYDAKKKSVLLLGFGIYYLDKKTDIDGITKPFINNINIDVITDYDGQKSVDVIRVFDFIMEQSIFEEIKIKIFGNDQYQNYIIWSDCGPQLRSKEILYYYFNTLRERKILVSLNYFAEKHGNF
jgi:hypothetical protein